jgi:hypothetical protein
MGPALLRLALGLGPPPRAAHAALALATELVSYRL